MIPRRQRPPTPRPPRAPATGTSAGRRTTTRRRPRRLASVWALSVDDGTGQARGWLPEIIRRVVDGYTRSGDRVLLVAPPAPEPPPASRGPARRADGLVPELMDAAQSASRLRRPTDVRTVASLTGPDRTQTQSGPPTAPPPGPTTDRRGPDRRPTSHGADRYPLIVTITVPHAADWTAAVSWDRLLTPTGILTILTHSEYVSGRFIDPCRSLLHTAGGAGLAMLDRIAVVAQSADATGAHQAVRQAHTEILLLTCPRSEAAATTGEVEEVQR